MKQVVLIFFLSFILSKLCVAASDSYPFFNPIYFSLTNFDFDSDHSLRVYPNPAINYINLTSNNVVSKLTVFDLIGKKVKTFKYEDGGKYYVGDLRKGIYLVQLIDTQNNIITTKRISKE